MQQNYKKMLKIASIIEIVSALWLIISPFILSFTSVPAALWNSIILGIIIAFLSSARAMEEGEEVTWPSWTNLILGVWLVISPFVLSFNDNMTAYWNTIILGILTIILSIWSLASTPKER